MTQPENKAAPPAAEGKLLQIFKFLLATLFYITQFMKKPFSKITHEEDQKITPWEAHGKGGIDYNKLIQKFGSTAIDQGLIDRYYFA